VELWQTGAIALLGFFTATLTGLVGLGGGAILLVAMLMFVPPAIAIPFHGMVQLAANVTRTWLYRQDIAWPLVSRFALLLIPGSALGIWLFQGLSERTIQVLIGVFVLATLYRGGIRAVASDRPVWWFIPLGFVVGALAVTVGVVGMLIGPFMLRKDLRKEAVNGSIAAMVMLGHLVKIGAFGAVGIPLLEMLPAAALVVPSVVVGTWVGRRMLGHVSERAFVVAFKVTLAALALKLVLWEGLLGQMLAHAVG